ncbi:hypothetical protein PP425_gp012 [Enterobacter phage vB_EclM_Q7622]|uniref:hypothetical protein n=1 Tax=Enterobacter phage vB_EclM_Q7622 TaxID=2908628 RepID=UPI00232991E6|nr:hypothetical protein PP425_gp012 [Enterobacter phage vB_EclM_Q7622]UIS65527.1 hypothetical protein Q76222_00012 [Enterobacter phage vB_EclM_Q7622]
MINILPADKYFVIGDREGFMTACGANTKLIKVFDDLGPIKLGYSQSEGIYNVFTTLSGKVMTSAELSETYSVNYSCHITKNEAMSFFVEWINPNKPEDETVFPNLLAIPEIRLTITTMEEVHAAIIMLQGLKDASV